MGRTVNGGKEKYQRTIELYKLLILTIVMAKDNIANQKICICVSRLDKDYPGPDGYCTEYRQEKRDGILIPISEPQRRRNITVETKL